MKVIENGFIFELNYFTFDCKLLMNFMSTNRTVMKMIIQLRTATKSQSDSIVYVCMTA